jgi:outer membrane protein TolC
MQLTRNNATWLVIFCFLGVSQALPVYGAADSLSLDQAVSEAVSTNPDLAAIQARARAMADIPAQKGALPDPTLSAAIANLPMDTFSTTQEPMTQMIIGLSQKLPFPGKLALQQQAAEFEGQAAGADVQEKRLQLVQDVKTVWWNLFYLDRALETVERNQELMRQFITITQTKYQVGNGLQQDVLLAQLELSKLFDLELAFNNTRQNEQSKMNALLDRPASQAINLSPAVDKNLGQPALFATLQNRAVNSRPLLISQQKRLEASLARVALAEKAYYPDFMVGANYGYRDGENANGSSRADFVSLAVSINLPIFTTKKQDGALSQRRNEKTQQEFVIKNSVRQVEAAIARALADYKRFGEEVDLYEKGIIPQARQTVQSMQSGYQVNKVDFLNLLRSQSSLYNYETKYWQALSGAKQALARLAAAVGEENIYE